MVSIFLPAQPTAKVKQELTKRPSIVTLQAPHTPMLQPSLVPVRPRLSRRTCSKSRFASISTSCSWPFTFSVSCFFISLITVIFRDLVGPAGQSILDDLHDRVAYEADYKDNHRNSKYFGGIELRAVLLRQRAETHEGNEHLTVDHSFDCAAHAEANACEHERQRSRQTHD